MRFQSGRKGYSVDSTEKFDIMKYGPGIGDGRSGLMTKEEARIYTQGLPDDCRVIGWVHGTCQSAFQFWVPEPGLVIEMSHLVDPPTGRKAAIMVQKAKVLAAAAEE